MWRVTYSSEKQPVLRCSTDVKEVLDYDKRVWCLQVPHGLLVAQRAAVDSHGTVVQASRPVVVGNCKFWELDSDHDGFLDLNDLASYDDYALTARIVERVMGGHGRPLLSTSPGRMNYLDFVVFLIAEIDKSQRVSVDFWFNALDLDSDGIVTGYEMEFFFDEQKQRIQALSQEQITFVDILCQLVDMIKGGQGAGRDLLPPSSLPLLPHSFSSSTTTSLLALSSAQHLAAVPAARFTKAELRASPLSSAFFNTLFNLNKFILSEQRDPLRIKQIHDTPQLSDWDRYAISGYYRLAEVDADDAPDIADSDDAAAAGNVVGEEVADDAVEDDADREWLQRRARGGAAAAAGERGGRGRARGPDDGDAFERQDVGEDGDEDEDDDDVMDVDDGHSDAHMTDSTHDDVKG